MARVRECPWAAQGTESVWLADRMAFSGRNSRKLSLDGINMFSMEKLWWSESDSILPWPDSRALFASQTEARCTAG